MDHTPPTPSNNPAASPAAVASAHGKVLRPTAELAEAMQRGYEPHDIGLRGVFIFLITLVVSLVVVLFAIYAIMMALVEHDRTHDALGTPVSVVRAEQVAPLQLSREHPAEDTDDMLLMRRQTNAALTTAGVSTSGRRFIPIDEAIDRVVPLLVVHPAPVPATQPAAFEPAPPGSHEGDYGGVAARRGTPRTSSDD